MKRQLALDDLQRMRHIADARLSPDGRFAAVVVHSFDVELNRVASRVHIVDVSNGSVEWVSTPGAESQPSWSRDSSRLAYLSRRGDEPVLIVHNLNPLADAVVVSGRRGLIAPRWSPDGSRIAFLAYGPEHAGSLPNPPLDAGRRLDRRRRPPDPEGLLDPVTGWTRKVWFVELHNGEQTQLTQGPYDDGCASSGGELEWSPDSARLVFAGNRTDSWCDNSRSQALYVLDVEGRQIVNLTPTGGRVMRPSFSADGRRLAFFASRGPREEALSFVRLFMLDLTTHEQVELSNATECAVGTTHNGEPDLPPTWSSGGLLTTICDAGSTNLVRFGFDGSIAPITSGAHVVQLVSGDAAGERIVAVRSTSTRPTELVAVEADELRTVFAPNSGLLEEVAFETPVSKWAQRGTASLQYWILLPGRGQSNVPVVLDIHGGPDSQYSETFYFDHMLWVAHGFAVVYGNPRGSHGYSPEFLNGVVHDWGGEDAQDVLAMLDDALASEPRLDATRMVVTGYSYGGYLTHRLVAITDRFCAAATGCGPTNLISQIATSDLGSWFARVHFGGGPNDKLDWFIERSPVFSARHISTPLLMYYGGADQRVPASQGEEMLYALHRAGIEVELISLPGENHGVARPIGIGTGTPAHQRAIRSEILDWFDQHVARQV
jgi:dipeptidyl aminopeptidase/acylaminoacyl peptidase